MKIRLYGKTFFCLSNLECITSVKEDKLFDIDLVVGVVVLQGEADPRSIGLVVRRQIRDLEVAWRQSDQFLTNSNMILVEFVQKLATLPGEASEHFIQSGEDLTLKVTPFFGLIN